jgi:hypothetical protein
MQFYRKAAAVGHHLALKRLECEEEWWGWFSI